MTDPMPVRPAAGPLAYAPPGLARRRPPRWWGVACLLVAAGTLVVGGFLGSVAGVEAWRGSAAVREARRIATLPTRALSPAEIARRTATVREGGPVTAAQVRTIEQLLAEPGQTLVPPRPAGTSAAGGSVPIVRPSPTGGVLVTLYGSHPFVSSTVALDAAGRLRRVDTADWSLMTRAVTVVAADGTRTTTTGSRQNASIGWVVAAQTTVAVAAAANVVLAVALAGAGVLLLAGRPAAWPLLRAYAWPQVAAGVLAAVAGQWMWYAGNMRGAPAGPKALVWWVPGVVIAGWGAVVLAVGRRRAGVASAEGPHGGERRRNG